MVRILGLDPGSRITGYGVVDAGGQGVRYVASGCIRVGQGEMAGRLLEIHRHVTELVAAYAPGEIAIERVFMARNPDSALKLGQARGAAQAGWTSYPPLSTIEAAAPDDIWAGGGCTKQGPDGLLATFRYGFAF